MAKDKRIKSYKTNKGQKLYEFQVYTGKHPITQKETRTRRRGFKTEQEAYIALMEIELAVATGTYEVQTFDKYKDIYELWLPIYRETVKESTYSKTVAMFKNHILQKFGHLKIDDVTPMYCQEVLNEWSKDIQESKRVMNYTGMVFNYAMKLDLIDRNPALLTTAPKRNIDEEYIKKKNFYNKDEVKQFMSAAKEYYYPKNITAYTLFRVLIYSGIRRGEALALKWDDIDFKNNVINVSKAIATGLNSKPYISSPKTKSSYRSVKIDSMTIKQLNKLRVHQKTWLLERGINQKNTENFVFCNTNGEMLTLTKPQKWLNTILKKYQLPKITLHGFRHTHCSLLFESGASIKEVQERLGHSDVHTTMNIYAHVTESAHSKISDNFEKYMSS